MVDMDEALLLKLSLFLNCFSFSSSLVEQPDAFAQLLHAHFTHTPIEHLQAYTHAHAAEFATPKRPTRSITGITPVPGSTNLTVRRLSEVQKAIGEDGANKLEDGSLPILGLAPSEDDILAARSSLSRRNSFLIQIDENAAPGLNGSTSTTSATPMNQENADALRAFANAAHRSHRASMKQRRETGCLSRCFHRVLSIPRAATTLTVAALTESPKLAFELLTHPFAVFSLPSRAFGLFKQHLGGVVMKPIDASHQGDQEPTARIMTR